jgi:hypothetical protein
MAGIHALHARSDSVWGKLMSRLKPYYSTDHFLERFRYRWPRNFPKECCRRSEGTRGMCHLLFYCLVREETSGPGMPYMSSQVPQCLSVQMVQGRQQQHVPPLPKRLPLQRQSCGSTSLAPLILKSSGNGLERITMTNFAISTRRLSTDTLVELSIVN